MARDAFHEHIGLIALGGSMPAVNRVRFDLRFLAVEERGQLAGVREQDGQNVRPSLRFVEWLEAVQQRRIEHDGCRASQEA